jgi:hypothetical protein
VEPREASRVVVKSDLVSKEAREREGRSRRRILARGIVYMLLWLYHVSGYPRIAVLRDCDFPENASNSRTCRVFLLSPIIHRSSL